MNAYVTPFLKITNSSVSNCSIRDGLRWSEKYFKLLAGSYCLFGS